MFWITATGLLGSFWGAYLLTSGMLAPLKKSFVAAGFVRQNFRGERIPVGMGAALWFGIFLTAALLLLTSEKVRLPWLMVQDIIGLVVVCTGMFVVGLLDDAVGNRDATGLKGHLRKLFREREVTTGLLKALTGVLIGGVGAWLLGMTGWKWLLCLLVVALSANSVNLLDLRPGRACKGVLLALIVLAFVSVRGLESPAYWLLLGATLAYLPDDLKARTMMGDAGSNLLGGGMGVLIITTCSNTTIIGWFAVLALFHLYAERYSLSETIEKHKWLRWLDVLGRSAS